MPNVKGDGHDSDTGVEREMYSCIAPVPSHNMLQWGLVPCVKVRIDDQTHNYNQQSIARERQTQLPKQLPPLLPAANLRVLSIALVHAAFYRRACVLA